MKVYVLTRVAAERNYTPCVFDDFSKAKSFFKEWVNEVIEAEQDSISSYTVHECNAEIDYYDDTYDVFEIFACEVH